MPDKQCLVDWSRVVGSIQTEMLRLHFGGEHLCVKRQLSRTALTHMTMDLPLLPAKREEWTDVDGTVVTLALDESGRHALVLTSFW